MHFGVEDTVPYFDRSLISKSRKIYHSDTLELQCLFAFGFVEKYFSYHPLTNLSLITLPMKTNFPNSIGKD